MTERDHVLRVRLSEAERIVLARLARRDGESVSATVQRLVRDAAARAGLVLPDGTPP